MFITLLMLVMFGAVWTMQGTWMLSGTGSSGCMNKILLPLLTSCDFQVSLDWLIDELNLHCSRWISEVASTAALASLLALFSALPFTSRQQTYDGPPSDQAPHPA